MCSDVSVCINGSKFKRVCGRIYVEAVVVDRTKNWFVKIRRVYVLAMVETNAISYFATITHI